MQIQGDFYAHSRYSSSSMSGGTLEIQEILSIRRLGYKGNFCVSGTHINKIFREQKQTGVRFADDSSYFNHVWRLKMPMQKGLCTEWNKLCYDESEWT